MAAHLLENDRLAITVDDHGAELVRIYDKQQDRDVLWEADPKFWARHAPILFPNVGKYHGGHYLYQDARYPAGQHGFARDMEFQLLSKTDSSVIHLLTSTDNTRKNYPFDFALKITQTLRENTIRIDWEVTNTGTDRMYFTIGGHPAFKVPILPDTKYSDYKLLFHEKKDLTYYLIDPKDGTALIDQPHTLKLTDGTFCLTDDLFETDALIFDEQFDWAAIGYPDGTPYVSVSCPGFPNFGIWAAKGGAPFVCLEPWMGRTDNYGFTGELSTKPGINALNGGKIFTASYTITIH